MGNNKNQALRLQEKQQKSSALINKATSLILRYPMISQRMSPILSLDDALHDSNSMAAIDAELGQGVSLDWVKGQLLDVFRLCGATDQFASIQVVVMARRIRCTYFYLSLSELTYFFESFAAGAYGTLYVGKSVNTQNVMAALRNFDIERANRLTEIAISEKHEIEDEKVASPSFAKEVCDRILKKITKSKK